MTRRAGVTAAVVVTILFFGIRLGIRLLAREAAPPPSPVVVRSPASPVALDLPVSPAQAKSDANVKLLALASEARAAKELETAKLAYDAQRALEKDDCARATRALTESRRALSPDSTVKGAVESAERSVGAYCASMADR